MCKAQTLSEHRIQKLREYFKPNAIVYLPYWNSYDKVISFNSPAKSLMGDWDVEVVKCDKFGRTLGVPRFHCTLPKELGGI